MRNCFEWKETKCLYLYVPVIVTGLVSDNTCYRLANSAEVNVEGSSIDFCRHCKIEFRSAVALICSTLRNHCRTLPRRREDDVQSASCQNGISAACQTLSTSIIRIALK